MPQIIFLSPVPWYYRTYSTRYYSVSIVAVPIPVGTVVILQHAVPITADYRGFTAAISPMQLSNLLQLSDFCVCLPLSMCRSYKCMYCGGLDEKVHVSK